jgi:hypothetical protein
MSDSPVYLTPKEAAELLRRSVKALYALIDRDATFPVTRFAKGGGLLIPRVPLERWLYERTEGMRGPLRLAVVPPASATSQRTDAPGALKDAAS